MKILALDSSGMVASVAVVDDGILIGEYTINHKKTHSQTLLPMLDEVVKMTELDLEEIDAIAVACGPGSFTGLRIGSATAKGLAQGLCKPIIEVPTLEGMAYQLYATEGIICPMLDARRNQVFTGIYEWKNGEFTVLEEQMAVPIEEIIEKVNKYEKKAIYLGDGALAFKEQLEKLSTVEYVVAPAFALGQRAASIATLAHKYMEEGKVVDAKDHKPVYLRMSQAERERLEKEKNEKDGK